MFQFPDFPFFIDYEYVFFVVRTNAGPDSTTKPRPLYHQQWVHPKTACV